MGRAGEERGRYFALIEDLAVPDPRVYWRDFLASVLAFYLAFAALVWGPLPRPVQLAMLLACSALAFRCAAFLHEVVHQGPGRLPGFGAAYNLLFGYVFKLPTFLYTPHLEHHSTRVFSTETDPEYTTWGERPARDLARHALFCVGVFPGLLVVRLGILPLVMPLLGGRARALIYRKASTLGGNRRYDRRIRGAGELGSIRRQEAMCAAYHAAFLALAGVGAWPWRAFVAWYAVTGVAMAINFFRGSINHGYAHRGPAVGFEAMILDSINVTRPSVWSRLWGPLHTRYHALHHLYPSLPYHALPAAHDRLMAALPADHPYRMANKRTYGHAFRDLVWSRHRPRPEGT